MERYITFCESQYATFKVLVRDGRPSIRSRGFVRHEARSDRFAFMINTPPAFIAFFEAQCADYGRSLPQRLGQIESLWRQALSGGTPAEALASLERCAHSLSGSGAIFGFAALGDAARALELAVKKLLGSAHALLPAAQTDVSRAVESLRHSLPGEPFIEGSSTRKLSVL
jgi:HPt (histidine-containing phosphotransfer) domain-containing protein